VNRPPDAAMSPERWRVVKEILATAIEHDGAERVAFLDRVCGDDATLRREVESLIAAAEAADQFLARPALDVVRDGVETEGPELAARLTAALDERYAVERELGGGGMARVFVATERALGRHVVIKVLPNDVGAGLSIERFKREIAFAARLQHANIVPLLAAGEVDGLPYYTMPFVEGMSLRSRLEREGRLTVRDAVPVLHDVARALAYAHDHGVIHRDIKPDNVLIAGGAAVVTDFGIAKAVSAARTAARTDGGTGDGATITQLGAALGTPAYMPPEQAAGDEVDHRADVYAFGCTAYELLTGRPPFYGRATSRLFLAHLTEEPAPVTAARGDLPPGLADIVMRCLAKDRMARPTAADIVQALDGGVALTPVTFGATGEAAERRAASRRPGRRAFLVGSAIVLATAPFVTRVWTHISGRGETAPRTIAVLRLENVGGDTTNEYFAAGLAEELTNALAKVEGLVVTPPGAESGATPAQRRDVARKLGVSILLGGSVQRAGDRLRVTVRLLDVTNDHVLWSSTYDKTLADVFAVQTDIADAVAASLRLTLSGTAKARVAAASGTRNAEAYLLYLQGRYAAARYTESDLRRSISLYEQAIQRDSSFARAWAGMADAWTALAGDFAPPNDILPSARQAAGRALALDSTLADAHVALGNVLLSDWDAAGASRSFERAVALERTSAATHYYAASALIALGRFDEAVDRATMAHRLEPGEPSYATAVALALLRAGRFDSAAATARRAFALDSAFTSAATVLGDALRLKGAPREALDAYAARGPAQTAYDLVGPALARIGIGETVEARRTLRELTALGARQNVPPDAVAMVYAGLGDRDQAFAWLERAYASHSAALVSLATDQDWAPLRSDPRFAALVRRVAGR
jgi:eukaryotic-like serine/threonine-protein kinase